MKALLNKVGLTDRRVIAWSMYDWANSAFATTVMVVILPIYFANVAAATLPMKERIAYWGYTSGFSVLAVALISPFLGTFADIIPWKKKLLGLFVVLGSLASVALFFVGEGDWLLSIILYSIGAICYVAGNVFYESLLPYICENEDMDKVSAAGFAVGYLGGGILLALNLAWISAPEYFGIDGKLLATKLSLASVGVWWLVFSIPLFLYVDEPKLSRQEQVPVMKAFSETAKQLIHTARSIANYKWVALFLFGFYFYMDGIWTVMKMATIFGRDLGISEPNLIGAMLAVQFFGVPFTFMYGPFTKRFGPKASIYFCLSIYIVACIFGYFMTTALHFWLLAIAVAAAQGGCQAISRSLFASIIPKGQSAEFFGFYSVSSKFAGILGPIVFGFLANALGESRYSILFVVSFFVIGMFILSRVDVDKARAAAAAKDGVIVG